MADGTRKLPVWATTKAAYGFFLGHLREFWRLAKMPMIVLYCLNLLAYFFLEQQGMETTARLGFLVLRVILMAPFLVAWHRLVLLGRDGIEDYPARTAGRREVVFFLWVILIPAPAGFVDEIIADVAPQFTDAYFKFFEEYIDFAQIGRGAIYVYSIVLTILISLVEFPLMAPLYRLGMVLPSIAIDAGASPAKAWRQSQSNTFRLAGILYLVSLPIGIVFIVISSANPYLLRGMTWAEEIYLLLIWGTAVDLLAYFVVSALAATALAMSYRLLTPVQENGEAKPAPPDAA